MNGHVIDKQEDNGSPDSYRVLGLDIGIGSCGWSLLDTACHDVVDMGVHLWSPPQNPKDKSSLASARRSARSARRNTRRTADRKKHCLKLFKKHDLVPPDADRQWLQTKKGDLQPLEIRVKGLDAPLTNRELAQALYNICARRGYIPHGEGSGAANDLETGKVLKAVSENSALMAEKGFRTVGEMMAANGNSRNKGGDYSHCVTNAQLVDEVHSIFAAQRSLGNVSASRQLEDAYLAVLTWEKESADHDERVYRQVGSCTYFPDLPRAAKATLSFEMCSAMERLAHAVIVFPGGREEKLPCALREKYINILFSPIPLKGNKSCKVTYADIRRELDLPSRAAFKGVDAGQEKKAEVFKPVCWRKYRDTLPQELMVRMRNDRQLADLVGEALAYASTEASLRSRLALAPLSEAEADAVCTLPFNSKMFSGYGTRSLEALGMLIEVFEDAEKITTLSEAEYACGLFQYRLDRHMEGGNILPPYQEFDKTCRNPVVLRVMGRVRKVVNAVIATYGMPDEIRIELARELKHSRREKSIITKKNRLRDQRRKAARDVVAEALDCAPESVPAKLLRKYELWVEQGEQDLYTGSHISFERMVTDTAYCQIDHILPLSRTCDDSQDNKALVLSKSNQDKAERSPFEWFGEDVERWDAFETRVCSLNLGAGKRGRLLERNLVEKQEGFVNRNLNDTRYACRAALAYLDAYLSFPENGRKRHTFAVAGGATAALRRAWGFSGKNREENDCHHATDAAIVAACTCSTVKKVALARSRRTQVKKDRRATLFADTEPWEGFAAQVAGRERVLVPTRMPEHGVTGRLFEDTVYSYKGLDEDGGKGMLCTRKTGTKPSSNYIVREDGSALKPDGQAFVRLWWDESLKARGKEEPGGFLIEPVYRSDLAAIRSGSYLPRYVPSQTARKPRYDWPLVPASAQKYPPVTLFAGDCIELNRERFRYKTVMISTNTWKLADMRSAIKDATKGHALSNARSYDALKIVREDVLGFCHKDYIDTVLGNG